MKLTKKELRIFISHSNAIEGEPKTLDNASRKTWEYLLKQKKLTPDVICKAHGILMKKKKINAKYRGAFRDVPVWIGREKKDNMMAIPNEILDWCEEWDNYLWHKRASTGHLLESHVEFEKIHPFIDGNGRLGRLLFLLFCKRTIFRFLYFDEKGRNEYYKIFGNVCFYIYENKEGKLTKDFNEDLFLKLLKT